MLALILAASIDFARIFPPLAKQQAEYAAAMTRLESFRGRVAKKPVDAIEAYNAALAASDRVDGFTAPPDQLLRTFAGIDLRDPNFVRDALDTLQPKIDELGSVYRQQP